MDAHKLSMSKYSLASCLANEGPMERHAAELVRSTRCRSLRFSGCLSESSPSTAQRIRRAHTWLGRPISRSAASSRALGVGSADTMLPHAS